MMRPPSSHCRPTCSWPDGQHKQALWHSCTLVPWQSPVLCYPDTIVAVSVALKGDFLLPDLEDAIRQFEIELLQFGPNLQQVGCTTIDAHQEPD